jgi:hypothetical protein
MEYAISILTADSKTHDFLNLEGPVDLAKTEALERFHKNGIGSEVVEALHLPMMDYYDAHQCRDTTGRGCCTYCGGVIPRSFLDREVHGDD